MEAILMQLKQEKTFTCSGKKEESFLIKENNSSYKKILILAIQLCQCDTNAIISPDLSRQHTLRDKT